MTFSFKRALMACSLGAMTLTGLAATPAQADPPPWAGHGRGHDRDRDRWRDDDRPADHRRAYREGYREGYNRPPRVIYSYDYNRPDPRYGRYYRPDRYYRSGYAPIAVTRETRIYRGYDDRYYCRRSDGTTGLIVGAALGGLIGSQLDRGRSNTAGILIGGGAGALLGREVDRGSLNCR
jgi:Ni/Co efflux regulator RcnB